jgi:hypothetical protein
VSVRLPSGGGSQDGAGREDDELLDRLGRGEPVEGGEVERMLWQWRASMPSAGAADDRLLDAVTTAIARPAGLHRRLRKAAASAAVLAVLGGGGLTAAAAQAKPDSPLWPVTELVFGGIAESRVAAQRADGALRDARTAVEQGRLPEATRLLAHADQLADKVHEPTAADRIRDDVAAIRERLDHRPGTAPPRPKAHRQSGPGAGHPNPHPGPGSPARPKAPAPDPAGDRPDSGRPDAPPTGDRSFEDSPASDRPFGRPSKAKSSTPSTPRASGPARAEGADNPDIPDESVELTRGHRRTKPNGPTVLD